MQLQLFIRALLLCLFPLAVNGFYYYSNGGESKCFNKELSKDAILRTSYSVQIFDSQANDYIDPASNQVNVVVDVLEVFDDNHRVVHQTRGSSGEFTFNAIESGEHLICLQPRMSGWLARSKTKVNVEFQVGSGSEIDSKKKEAMQVLHQRVIDLIDKAMSIRGEQTLVREREAQFRDTSERTNSSAMWWAIITLIVMGGVSFWQLHHLRSFFVKQKVL
ncbi:HFL011Cp [Eremothecium sinecaudum]|uniref:HFL011Cp n=1 Tax=Eremothecium sinecaudum TaxID=45286 RepID=A0A0X8HUW8_9SACH|nr:HFL011Cp [Eremothecium sinecaudum]AMD21845.1 HFL011Cp [Eremothecium sinecaudum]